MTTHASALTTLTASEPRWLDRGLYPFASRFIEIEGHNLHYIDEGSGPVVLFVHGTPSWSFEWRAQVAALSEQYRCIALDHLGFGLSEKPERATYKPEDHARRLLQFVVALDLRDVTLVVHDFGGPIGIGALLADPRRFERVVFVNSWLWGLNDRPEVVRISRVVRSWLGRFLYRVVNLSPRVLLPASFGARSRLSRRVHGHYLAPFPRRRDRTAPWVLGCELAGSSDYYESLWQQRERLPQVAAIVWGMRDPMFDPTVLARLEAAFPSARVTRIAHAGHFPQEEAPAQVVHALREVLALRRAAPELASRNAARST